MDSQHEHLLHTELDCCQEGDFFRVLWSSRKKHSSFKRKQFFLAEFLLDEMLISKLAYLPDIFHHFHLNKLNKSLQGFCINFFALRNKTDTFKNKLNIFMQKGDIEMFST